MKSVQIQDCPSALDIPASSTAQVHSATAYAANVGYLNPLVNNAYTRIKITALSKPTETIMMTDVASISITPGVPIVRTPNLYPPSQFYHATAAVRRPTVHGRHLGTASVLWCDGHVKAMRVTPRPSTNYGNAAVTAESLAALNLGDILLNNEWKGNALEDDYYFRTDK